MRADFSKEAAKDWHTLLGKPKVVTLKIDVPVGKGYVLTSKKTGRMLAMVDVLFMQQEIFKQLPKEEMGAGKLVIAMTKNVTYYTSEDATECCSWGTHGIDTTQGLRAAVCAGKLSRSTYGGGGQRCAAADPAAGTVVSRSAAPAGAAPAPRHDSARKHFPRLDARSTRKLNRVAHGQ